MERTEVRPGPPLNVSMTLRQPSTLICCAGWCVDGGGEGLLFGRVDPCGGGQRVRPGSPILEALGVGEGAAPLSTLMLQMLGSFAQFELSMIRERQREGIAIAKAAGKYRGRKAALPADQQAQLRAAVQAGGRSKADVARDFGISRETLYAYLRPSAVTACITGAAPGRPWNTEAR